MKKLIEALQEKGWKDYALGAAIGLSTLSGAVSPNTDAPTAFADTVNAEANNTVAMVIAGEAAGEGYMGMKAVACVIQNRMKGGKTAEQVVTKRKQFSAYEDKELMKRNYAKVKKEADEIASQIGKLDDVTGGADHYVAQWLYDKKKDDKNHWISKMIVTKTIGKHVFMKQR